MKKNILSIVIIILFLPAFHLHAAEDKGAASSWFTNFLTTIANMSWQRKLIATCVGTVVVGLVLQKIGVFGASSNKSSEQSTSKIQEGMLEEEKQETIEKNDLKPKEKQNDKKIEATLEEIRKQALLFAQEKGNASIFANLITNYAGNNCSFNLYGSIQGPYLAFDLKRDVDPVREYWQNICNGVKRDLNFDDFEYQCQYKPIFPQKINNLRSIPPEITNTETLKTAIAGLYKVHVIAPAKDEKINKDFCDLITDIDTSADILTTILELIKTDSKFAAALEGFKFSKNLSIRGDKGLKAANFVLYTVRGKENAQLVASTLSEKIGSNKLKEGYKIFIPRFDQAFSSNGVSYRLGESFNREKLKEFHDGPFFNEKFFGVSKQDQMLKVPENKNQKEN